MRLQSAWLVLSFPLMGVAASSLPPAAAIKIDFTQHVQPILATRCHSCHGSKQQQSGLRLDKRQNALRGGDYGPVIVPGKSAESKLILRVAGGDGGLQMPPTGALSTEEIGILRAWIDQGAEFADVEIKESAEASKPVDPKLRDLILAVRNRDLKSVTRHLKADPQLANGRDAAESTPLHHAAGFASVAIMKALLDRGAGVNATNRSQATPLHWAILDPEKAGLLIERGANVNAKTADGRTPLYLATSQRNGIDVLRILLEKGADPNLALPSGRTPLMAAAGGGGVAMIRLLLEHKANPQAASGTGSVALMDAAAIGDTEVVRLLLERGANPNARTKRNQSALAMAAGLGSEPIVRMLLDRGAQVNVRDERGYSPLMYAAYSEALPAGIVRLLLDKGADLSVKGEGETPKSLAAKRGDTEVARLLGVPESHRKLGGVASGEPGSAENRPLSAAVQKAAALLEKQSTTFIKRGGCNSCHNQTLPAASLALARKRGIQVPKTLAQVSLEMLERSAERTMEFGVISMNSVGYELFGYVATGRPADEYTDSLIHYVKAMQTPEGYWQTANNRPPMTFDHFNTTAMALEALRTYAPAAQKEDTERRLARAAAWLETAKPANTQERAFHLLGLKWAKAKPAVIERAARALAETQRPAGGWAQLPSMGADAYATGEALYALHLAGKMPVNDSVYQKGVRYLLRTQAPDGSWHVKTRSLPLQPYFDSGYPYGHDQWISAAGASWASMALSLAVEPVSLSRR